MLQVQRANREELGRTCPHRPGGGWLPWKGLSQPQSGAGKVPGRLGLHSQPLPRMKANRALNPNLNAARFPPSIPSPPCCQARTRAGHQASLTHCLALRAEAPRTNTVAVRGPRVPQTTRGVKSLPRGSPSGSAKSCPLSELASAQSLSCPPHKEPSVTGSRRGAARPMPGRGPCRRLTVACRPPTPRPVLFFLDQSGPPNPQSPLPSKSSVPAYHPQGPPSSRSPAGRARAPTSPLAARRSPSTPANPPEPRTRSLAGGRGVCDAHAHATIHAHLCERPRGERTFHAPVRALRFCALSRCRERAGLLRTRANLRVGSD